MKILPISDIHAESSPWNRPQGPIYTGHADLVIAAGDIHTKGRGPSYLRSIYGDAAEIVFVPGNHEYYGASIKEEDDRLRSACEAEGIHFLQCDSVTIQGVKIAGCTLWTDFELFGQDKQRSAMFEAQKHIMDYPSIYTNDKKLRTVDPLGIREVHTEHRDWLKQQQPDIVVTHHCPLTACVHLDFAEDLASAAFASNLAKLVDQSGAKYWICGHSHIAKRFLIGKTEVVMNCCGYYHEQVKRFNPGLILEI